MTWNGEDYPFDAWEANQTLSSAMKNSVNWYFQSIDSQLGFHSVKSFLQKIQYGNQQTGSDIDLYWTDRRCQKFHPSLFRSQKFSLWKNRNWAD